MLSYLQSGKHDIGRIILSLIYITFLGPVFAIFRWRFRRAVRFVPVLIFLAFAVYLSIGATLPGAKKMISGVE
jgi:hypothetical protein